MYHIIYLLIIALLVYVLYLVALRGARYKEKVEDAQAREQGLDEVEEGYQAEIMDLEDKLHNVYESHRLMKEGHIQTIHEYDTQISELQQKDLHSQEHIVQLKARLTDAQQAGLEMQQRLVDHEENCLPHVKLSDDADESFEEFLEQSEGIKFVDAKDPIPQDCGE